MVLLPVFCVIATIGLPGGPTARRAGPWAGHGAERRLQTPAMEERHAELDPVLERHGHRPDGLIEVLSAAQERYGHLSPALLRHVAQQLRLPLSRVLGTASFYHLFRFAPAAAHSCLVCTGTACHVLGAEALLASLQAEPLAGCGIELGVVRCIGTCSGAPLLVVDGQVWNHQNADGALTRLRRLPP